MDPIMLVILVLIIGLGVYIYGVGSSHAGSSSAGSSSGGSNFASDVGSSAACTLSPSAGSSTTYYIVHGFDTSIQSSAFVIYDPSVPAVVRISNDGTPPAPYTLTSGCGTSTISGTILMGGSPTDIQIILGTAVYINDGNYQFSSTRGGSVPPPPHGGGPAQTSFTGYTHQGPNDVSGFDITGGPTTSITGQSCANACNAIDACIGFSFDSGNTICNLKAASYSGTNNSGGGISVDYYSKDTNAHRYFVLYNISSQRWLTISDASGGRHNGGNNWYYMSPGTGVHLRDSGSSKPLPGQSVWYYNSKSSQFVSALSPNWVLSYDTNGNVSIQNSSATGMGSSLYYSTTKSGGTKQIMSPDSKILMSSGGDGVQAKPNVSGPTTQWELVYLPTPTIAASLPTGFDWDVVFLLRTKTQIATKSNQYGYLCAPADSLTGAGCSYAKPLTCIYESDNPFNNPGAFWSCWGQTSTYATIYVRSNPSICMQGGSNNGSQINIINSCRDPDQRNDHPYTGFWFTSDGFIQCGSNFIKLDTSLSQFTLTSDKSSATPLVCIHINPSNLDLTNYKTNNPEIF